MNWAVYYEGTFKGFVRASSEEYARLEAYRQYEPDGVEWDPESLSVYLH